MKIAKGMSKPFLRADGRDATASRTMTTAPSAQTLGDEFKIFVSRIPAVFDELSVRRVLETALQNCHRQSESDADASNAVVSVSLAYGKDEDTPNVAVSASQTNKTEDRFADRHRKKKPTKATQSTALSDTEPAPPKQHKGYGFVTLSTVELVQEAIATVRTVRGGAKPTSTRHYTLYIGPCLSDDQKAAVQCSDDSGNPTSSKTNRSAVCFLWTAGRCPYGPDCRFAHTGPGGCAVAAAAAVANATISTSTGNLAVVKKPRKCRDFRKGKCQFSASDCPFSHDFVVPAKASSEKSKSLTEKDCIDWKTKGKCRNLSKQQPCPYKHDPAKQKKRPRADGTTPESQSGADVHDAVLDSSQRPRKLKQPLTVRVFGLNYDTTLEAIRALFSPSGRIVDLQLPTFVDSGRNKGYCGITYTSPQAVAAAVSTCHGVELDGRWISVQAGAMLLDQWEEHHVAHRTAKK
jgi:RNA recognition motif-containing protein